MFSDLDWPLNASRGFVSIRWASYFDLTGAMIPSAVSYGWDLRKVTCCWKSGTECWWARCKCRHPVWQLCLLRRCRTDRRSRVASCHWDSHNDPTTATTVAAVNRQISVWPSSCFQCTSLASCNSTRPTYATAHVNTMHGALVQLNL